MRVVLIVASAIVALANAPADAQNGQANVDVCIHGWSHQVIVACSAAIESTAPNTPLLSTILADRGAEYQMEGDTHRAIADESEALRINPRQRESLREPRQRLRKSK
jgi:hypothetical protein